MAWRDDDGAKLWQMFKKGDKESFYTLYHTQFNTLFEYGMRLVHDSDLVKDCLHDLFVKLWENKAQLGEVVSVRSYLLVALRSTVYNTLQKNKRIELYGKPDELPFEMEFSTEDRFIENESRDIRMKQLISALEQLTPRQKEAVYLRYFQDMEYEEIASALNISVKATYKLTARGLDALKKILQVSYPSLLLLLGHVLL